MELTVRPAERKDYSAMRRVLVDAFGRTEEADIVAQLRADGDTLLELVAADRDAEIVGCISFSRMASEGGRFGALGPVAVATGYQNLGVGDALCRAGIAGCKAQGIGALVVLGHPTYYPRFGFSAAAAKTFKGESDRPAYMALELTPGALEQGGVVTYAPAFRV